MASQALIPLRHKLLIIESKISNKDSLIRMSKQDHENTSEAKSITSTPRRVIAATSLAIDMVTCHKQWQN
jgi:hypothetical protein